MFKIIYKIGLFSFQNEDVFYKKNHHPSYLTFYIHNLINSLSKINLKENIEIHFNSQPSISFKKKYLILLEHPYIRPQNYFIFSKRYRKIFGWDLRLKNKKNFFYVKYPHFWSINSNHSDRSIRYSMVCTNRNIIIGSSSESLYNKRQEVINYCEKNPKLDFNLYGSDWNLKDMKPGPYSKVLSVLSKNGLFSIERDNKLVNYKGRLNDKNHLLRHSKFNFCFENLSNYEGYVSEKIWDSISAGAIPIYWPSWNVPETYLPSECYINAAKFESIHSLFYYLESISDEELYERRKVLYKIALDKSIEISIDNYASLITNEIIEDLK